MAEMMAVRKKNLADIAKERERQSFMDVQELAVRLNEENLRLQEQTLDAQELLVAMIEKGGTA